MNTSPSPPEVTPPTPPPPPLPKVIPKNPNGFDDPYEFIPVGEKTRTTINVSAKARSKITAVYPKKGYLQTTINILIEKLTNELKRAGLTQYNPEGYEIAVAQCTILLGGVQYAADPSNPGSGSPVGPPSRKRKGGKSTKAD